ncbi:MAG: DUF11 domain-containing protein [Planctomycetota bacterium]
MDAKSPVFVARSFDMPAVASRRRERCRRLQIDALEQRCLLASDILLGGIDAPPISPTNHATISVIDLVDSQVSPIEPASQLKFGAVDPHEGVTGIAVLPDGTTITSISPPMNQNGMGPHADQSEIQIRRALPGHSGATNRFSVTLEGQALGIADLTSDPTTGRLFGITSPESISHADGFLVEIDPRTGQATLIGDTELRNTADLRGSELRGRLSIALDTQGRLWATRQENGLSPLELHQINPDTGRVIASIEVQDAEPFGLTTGLTADLDSQRLIGSESILGRLFTIDLQSGVRTLLATQAPVRGISGDIAVHPRMDSDRVTQLYHADFESNDADDQLTIDNSGGDAPGLWHRSLGRRSDGQLNHSPNHAFYYGAFEESDGDGHYLTGVHHRGVITTPEVVIPNDGTSVLSFSYLLDTRPELTRDFVSVSIDNRIQEATVLQRSDGSLPETIGDWLTATVDLSEFAGQSITVSFTFDTGDPVRVDPEGWYVDDIVIVHLADPQPLEADLGVTKSANVDSFTPGEEIEYAIVATNQASTLNAVSGVTIVDTLPDDLAFISASDAGVYDAATHTVTWSDIELPVQQPRTFQVRGQTVVSDAEPHSCDEVLLNRVDIMADESVIETNPADNFAVTETPIACVDLLVDKTGPSTAFPTETITYVIEVTNKATAGDDATNIVVTDDLPDGVTFIDASPACFFVDDPVDVGRVVWVIDELQPGQMEQFEVTVQVDEPAIEVAAMLTNVATALADQPDEDIADNRDELETNRPSRDTDVSIVKSAEPSAVVAGVPFTYRIVVTNNTDEVNPLSRRTATNVSVVDELPDEVDVISISDGGQESDGRVVWPDFDLPLGQSRTFSLVVTIPESDDCQSGMLTNRATANADEADPNEGNNEIILNTNFTCALPDEIDLSISKSVDNANPTPGGLVTYEITITNPSMADATDVRIVDVLPAGIVFDSSSIAPTLIENQVVTWAELTVPALSTLTLRLAAAVMEDAGGTVLTNAAEVTSDHPDPDTDNNRDVVTVTPNQTVQFITPVSVFREPGGEFGPSQFPGNPQLAYSPYVRPADQLTSLVDEVIGNEAFEPLVTRANDYRSAISAFQQFRVTAPDQEDLVIDAINKSFQGSNGLTSDEIAAFVTIYEVDGDDELGRPIIGSEVRPSTFPLAIAAGQTRRFTVMYDPAIRDETGAVTSQRPDWFESPDASAPKAQAHTFANQDQLMIQTRVVDGLGQEAMRTSHIRLVGGSTFDSDITYDAQVDELDVNRLQTIFAGTADVIRQSDPNFDRTSDINARCPNGADQQLGTCVWDINDPLPEREIGLGDVGPINVELQTVFGDGGLFTEGRSRSWMLDLDSRTGSASTGLDRIVGPINAGLSVPVVDDDAHVAVDPASQIQSWRIRVADPSDGELTFEGFTTNLGDEIPADSGTEITLSLNPVAGLPLMFAEDWFDAVKLVRFTPTTEPSGLSRMVTIEMWTPSGESIHTEENPLVLQVIVVSSN